MNPYHTKNIMNALFILLLIYAGLMQLWSAIIEQTAFIDIASDKRRLSAYQRDPVLLNNWARKEHLYAGRIEEARDFYLRAVESNPLYMPAWIGLAELMNDTGDTKKAREIMGFVNDLTQDIQKWRWSKALVAYQLGELDTVSADLRYMVSEMKHRRYDALKMAHELWQDPVLMLEKLGSENAIHIFEYFKRNSMPRESLVLWDKIEALGMADKELAINYTHFLLHKKHVSDAKKVWNKYISASSGIYDSGFDEEPLNKAFGWRWIKSEDVEIGLIHSDKPARQDDSYLKVNFTGKSNISFHHVLQIIPVEPLKTYCLNAQARTIDLSTDKRPYMEISGFDCKGLNAKTPMFDSKSEWNIHTLRFDVPEGCEAVVLRIKRDKSLYFDNKITGTLFLDNLYLKECAEGEDIAEQ